MELMQAYDEKVNLKPYTIENGVLKFREAPAVGTEILVEYAYNPCAEIFMNNNPYQVISLFAEQYKSFRQQAGKKRKEAERWSALIFE